MAGEGMIVSLDDVTEFPLCWPDTKPRASQRKDSPFGATLAKAMREIEDEMRRYRAKRFIVSMSPIYRRTQSDPAVAVWFELMPKGSSVPSLRVIACDSYRTVESNAHAVALTLKGLRAFERYGTYTQEQALEGARLGLPPPNGAADIDWRAVLGAIPAGIEKPDALLLVNGRYRRLAAEASDDQSELRRLNLAVEKARQELAA